MYGKTKTTIDSDLIFQTVDSSSESISHHQREEEKQNTNQIFFFNVEG